MNMREIIYRLVSALTRSRFVEADYPITADVTIDEFRAVVKIPGLLELLDKEWPERMDELKKWCELGNTVNENRNSPFWKEKINLAGQLIPDIFFIREKEGKFYADFFDNGEMTSVELPDYKPEAGYVVPYVDTAYAMIVLSGEAKLACYSFTLRRLLVKRMSILMDTPEAEEHAKRIMAQ